MFKLLGAALLGTLIAAPAIVAPATAKDIATPSAASEFSSQRDPRTRLRVRPGGRLLYRDCTFRLAQEWRPSGTVIVPVQRCWWVRG